MSGADPIKIRYEAYHDSLNNTSSLLGSVNTETHVLDVVERIEHTENVETVLYSAGRELRVGHLS